MARPTSVTELDPRLPAEGQRPTGASANADLTATQALGTALYETVKEAHRRAGPGHIPEPGVAVVRALSARGFRLVVTTESALATPSTNGNGRRPEPVSTVVAEAIAVVAGGSLISFDWPSSRALLAELRQRGLELALAG